MKKIYLLLMPLLSLLLFSCDSDSDDGSVSHKELADGMRIERTSSSLEDNSFFCEFYSEEYIDLKAYIVKSGESAIEITNVSQHISGVSFKYSPKLELNAEYSVYIVVDGKYKCTPLVFTTPRIQIDHAKLLADIKKEHGNAVNYSPALEGAVFEVSGIGFYDGMSAEIVELANDNRYSLDVEVESDTKLRLTFPDDILKDDVENYEYYKACNLVIDGETVWHNILNVPWTFRLYNYTPLIQTVDTEKDAKKVVLNGYYYTFLEYFKPTFFNRQLKYDSCTLHVKQNGGILVYESLNSWNLASNMDRQFNFIHGTDEMHINKSILERGEVTVYLIFSIGGELMKTNEFTFTY